MKLSYSTIACPEWSLEQALAAVPRYGYDGLELNLLDGERLPPNLAPEARRRVREQFGRSRIPLCCLDTPLRIAQPDPAARAQAVRDGLAYLEMAAEWGAPAMRVFGSPPAGTPMPAAIEAAAEALAPLAERGAQLGVAVALETHDAFHASRDVMRALEQAPGQGAGALWDVYGPHVAGEAPADTASRLAGRILHAHINDGRPEAQAADGWQVTFLGEGQVPVFAALQAMRNVGYAGWLSVEWVKKWIPSLPEPEFALPQHAAVLRKYLAELT
jgi:sugar phosphate isomerase/epimerase